MHLFIKKKEIQKTRKFSKRKALQNLRRDSNFFWLIKWLLDVAIGFTFFVWFGELLLPSHCGSFSVKVLKDEGEDVGVPAYGLAVDAFFDIL